MLQFSNDLILDDFRRSLVNQSKRRNCNDVDADWLIWKNRTQQTTTTKNVCFFLRVVRFPPVSILLAPNFITERK